MSRIKDSAQYARTKIVATVGPACRSELQLETLVNAGVDVFRLNMAHGDLGEHTETMARVRAVAGRLRSPIGVLVDLAGPKIRLGELPGGQIDCVEGAELVLVRGESSDDPSHITVTYDRLIDELEVGKTVMLADGTVGLRVDEVAGDHALLRVVQGGIVRSRQGVNLPGVQLSLPAMDDQDRRCAAWAARSGVDYISLSFVRRAGEIDELKRLVRDAGSAARIVAKIEKQEALDDLPAIVGAADAVMVARGDLGVEIDVARMAVVQKEIVSLCNAMYKPVIIATQMLDSMQRNRRPTRAEVTDVANAILDGCDACMLSGETAVGEYPREAVEMMNRIALATEPLYLERPLAETGDAMPEELRPVTRGVIVGAGHIAQELDARLIGVASHTGATALALSKQRGFTRTVGLSDREEILRQMCLFWGVIPLCEAPVEDADRLLAHLEAWGRKDMNLADGEWVVLVAGRGLPGGGHNMIMVHEVGRG